MQNRQDPHVITRKESKYSDFDDPITNSMKRSGLDYVGKVLWKPVVFFIYGWALT